MLIKKRRPQILPSLSKIRIIRPPQGNESPFFLKMEKKKQPPIHEDIEERILVKMGAGCPLTDFGNCKANRCAFFVITNLHTGESEYAIRASYFQQLLNDIMIRSVSLFSESGGRPLSEISIHLAVSNLVSALRHLDGLSVDPLVAPHLRLKLRKMKQNLREALKNFSERKI